MESRQKVLVFTQFREMGEMLQNMIEQRLGIRTLFLHGGCSIKERQAMVERFQQNITQNTFEERIDKMIQDKRHLADMTVANGENWIGKLSNSELREIFR